MVGAPENTVSDNTFIDCPVGVMVGNYNSYYIANYPIEAGSRSVIANNEFIDTTGLDVWFTFFSYGEDVEIKDNEFKGTYPTMYGVYAQSQYSSGQVVTGNTFNNTSKPIYMRGSTDWTISQNTINGVGDASYAGIYELESHF
jgi:parallel beta-helix repeat protein